MIEQTFSLSGPADLDVSVPSGSLTIESGSPGRVEIYIDSKDPEGWRVENTGDTVLVTYERGFPGRGGRARVRIVAPEQSALRAKTASADILARVDLGAVAVNTASGEVRLADVRSVTIKTASGDVTLGRVDDALTIRSASGDVRAQEVGGALSVTTASGDVRVERVEGPMSVSSASGDVSIGVYAGDDLEMATMSGDLDVGLIPGRVVKLRANTLSGSVQLPQGRSTPTEAGPEVSVSLKSVSGDLRIRRVE